MMMELQNKLQANSTAGASEELNIPRLVESFRDACFNAGKSNSGYAFDPFAGHHVEEAKKKQKELLQAITDIKLELTTVREQWKECLELYNQRSSAIDLLTAIRDDALKERDEAYHRGRSHELTEGDWEARLMASGVEVKRLQDALRGLMIDFRKLVKHYGGHKPEEWDGYGIAVAALVKDSEEKEIRKVLATFFFPSYWSVFDCIGFMRYRGYDDQAFRVCRWSGERCRPYVEVYDLRF